MLNDGVNFGRSRSSRRLEQSCEGTDVGEGIGRGRRRGVVGREREEVVAELRLGREGITRI